MAMKITIVGAGAIGGLAGAYMTRAGHDICSSTVGPSMSMP